MSSFKRKTPSTQIAPPPGTRPCITTPSVLHLSTGIPSLDDILGGGLALGCVLLILTPDPHSAWGNLMQRYFIAQGLRSGQGVCVVGGDEAEVIDGCMWVPGEDQGNAEEVPEESEGEKDAGEGVKIAWRYEKMKRFQTTVPVSSTNEDYCHTFDLTCRIPQNVVAKAKQDGQLLMVDVSSRSKGTTTFDEALSKIKEVLQEGGYGPQTPVKSRRRALRLCLPDFGGVDWGDSEPHHLLRFLYSLRGLIRSTPVAALLTLPPHLSKPQFQEGWIQKLGFLSDGCISLSGFGADPSLSATFPTYNGLVQIHSTPSPHTLLPPSDKLSQLRGLSSSSSANQGGGENNLAFRCMRKRFVFETLHLDVEGGVGERRTAPGVTAGASTGTERRDKEPPADNAPLEEAKVAIGVESVADGSGSVASDSPKKKPRKKVAFHSDRPELYDF